MIRRGALEERLDEAFDRRLVLVVAGAGYGKSTLLSQWTDDVESAWYTASPRDRTLSALAAGLAGALREHVEELPPELPAALGEGEAELMRAELLAALLCDALRQSLTHDLILVVDDVHEIATAPSSLRLVESLCRQAPPTLHVVLASREAVPLRLERLRGRGEVLELTGADLSFTLDEVGALLEGLPGGGRQLVAEVHALTGGWPAAVRLALEALRRVGPRERGPAIVALRQPGNPLFSYLAQEVFEAEPPQARSLLSTVAALDRFTPELCDALGLDGVREVLDGLAQRGLFLADRDGWLSLHALVREFALAVWPLADDERRRTLSGAADWLESHGHHEDAIRTYAAASQFEEVARLLVASGDSLLAAGLGDTVLELGCSLPPSSRSPQVELLMGDALLARGDAEGALRHFCAAEEESRRPDAALAWRLVAARAAAEDYEGAWAAYERANSVGGSARDRAHLDAMAAAVSTAVDKWEEGRHLVDSALELAHESRDDRALADAHAAALVRARREGSNRDADAHAEAALAAAVRARDSLRLARARGNVASLLIDRGRYRAAIEQLDGVVELADVSRRKSSLHALGLRGVAHWFLGLLDEARADYDELVDLGRHSPRHHAFGLVGIGDVQRERGNATLARAAYQEAVAEAERAGDQTLAVMALSGLGRSMALDDPDEAAQTASRALAYPVERAWALNAAGWIALAAGKREEAAALAAEALGIARDRRQPYELAEALELGAFATDPAAERARLEEALTLWRELDNHVRIAVGELAVARSSAGPDAHAAAGRAERKLRSLGIRVGPGLPAGLLSLIAEPAPPPLLVQTLGGFRLLREGVPVAAGEWPSRRARDLLKILVARRGRATPREFLMEALWPAGEPSKLSGRLSVALSTLRAVLDPNKHFPQDHFVRADRESLALDLRTAIVDVEIFLHEAEESLALRAAGSAVEAAERLEHAASTYAGDFLDEDPYADWANALREESRSASIAVAHALAHDALAAGDTEAAVSRFFRILDRDPYDEAAHVGLGSALVLVGRHGEARRAYRTYVRRMEEVGAPPAARSGDPALV